MNGNLDAEPKKAVEANGKFERINSWYKEHQALLALIVAIVVLVWTFAKPYIVGALYYNAHWEITNANITATRDHPMHAETDGFVTATASSPADAGKAIRLIGVVGTNQVARATSMNAANIQYGDCSISFPVQNGLWWYVDYESNQGAPGAKIQVYWTPLAGR